MRIKRPDLASEFVRRKAERLVQDGRVCFVRQFGPYAEPHLALYWVLGDSLEVHNVVLDTKKHEGTCSCQSVDLCSHIVAAMMVEEMVNWEPA